MEIVKTAWELPVTGVSSLNILHNKLCNTARARELGAVIYSAMR
jgi:hypothetical protein